MNADVANAFPSSVGNSTTFALLNLTTTSASPDVNGDGSLAVEEANFQFSLWVIVVMSLTCLFTIAFILCGLFKRADAYHMPLTPEGEVDVANIEGLGLQGHEGMFGISGAGAGWA